MFAIENKHSFGLHHTVCITFASRSSELARFIIASSMQTNSRLPQKKCDDDVASLSDWQSSPREHMAAAMRLVRSNPSQVSIIQKRPRRQSLHSGNQILYHNNLHPGALLPDEHRVLAWNVSLGSYDTQHDGP